MCVLTNILRLSVQILRDCLISLLIIIIVLLTIKIEYALEILDLCAIQFRLGVFMMCQHSKVVHRIFFFKKNCPWDEKG